MSLESANALAILLARSYLSLVTQLPHLDRLVQATTDQLTTVGREGNRVDTVSVSSNTFEPLNEVAARAVPDSHALIEGSGGDKSAIRRHGDRGYAIFNGENHDLSVRLNVPKSYSLVPRARRDESTAASEIKRVDVLFMAIKCISDAAALNIPHANAAVFSSRSEQLTVRREADRANVQIAFLVCNSIVLQLANLLAVTRVKDLCAPVTPSGHVATIMREADAAYDRLMDEVVKKLDIQDASNSRVEDGVPIIPLSLQMIGKSQRVQVGQHIANIHGTSAAGQVVSGRVR